VNGKFVQRRGCAADKEPTRGPHVHYCYSSALHGSEYVEIVYPPV